MQSRENKPDLTSYFDYKYLSSVSNIHRLFNSEKKGIDHPEFQWSAWFYALLPLIFTLMEYLLRPDLNNDQDTFSAIRNMNYVEYFDRTKLFIDMMAIYTVLYLIVGLSEIDRDRAKLKHSVDEELFLVEQEHNIEVWRLQDRIEESNDELKRSTSIYENDRRLWARDRDAYIKQILELSKAKDEKPAARRLK